MSDNAAKKICPFCSEKILAVAKKCKYCGEYLDEEARKLNRPIASGAERLLIPVGRPGSAIAAGYLALIGILPIFGLPFSIGAIITGCIALSTLKKQPELSGAGRAWFGIICGSIATSFSLIGVIALIASAAGRP